MDMNEKEINLSDLLVEMLLHWRLMLVMMLVGGVLLGSFGYLQSWRSVWAQSQVDKQEASEEEAALPQPQLSGKDVMLGIVLSVFLYAFVIFAKYILNKKLRDIDSLQELYGIPQLGTVLSAAPKVRTKGGKIDQWILQLRYQNKRRITVEESIHLAAVAVKLAAKKQELDQVCLVGCNVAGAAQETCESIRAVLAKEQIEAVMLNNVLYDAETMEKLEHAQGVVLVETAGLTLYEEIKEELNLLSRQNICVLGGIIVESV